MKPDPVAVSRPLNVDKEPSAEIFDDMRMNLKAYSSLNLWSSSNCYTLRRMQLTRASTFQHETNETNKCHRIEQLSDAPGVAGIKLVA